MKIALCLHGLVGSQSSKYGGNDIINIDITYKFLKKNLLNSKKNKFDIFLHTQSYEEKKKLLKLYKPKLYKIEKQKNFDFSKNHPHLKNLKLLKLKMYLEKLFGKDVSEKKIVYLIKKAFACYSRWYSFGQSINLKRKYEKLKKFRYDLVFITRYDLIIKKKFKLETFDKSKLTVSNHNIIPGPKNDYKVKARKNNITKEKGISDLWFASSSKNMDKFANLYKRITSYPLSNHFSSYYHSKHTNLDLDFRYYRYFDFELLRRMNKSKE
tara:strand:+ start:17253 stop:18056 length:804 start_codon:yes stop_codon:yes gene_type:complete